MKASPSTILRLALLLVTLPLACNEEEPAPEDIDYGPKLGTTTIGPEGGRMSSGDGRVILTIEPGTFSTPTQISFRRVESAPNVLAGPIAAFDPDKLALSPSGHLEMLIDVADLGGAAISSTVMATWDTKARRWVPLPEQSTSRRDDGLYSRTARLATFGVVAAAVSRQQGDARQCGASDACRVDNECAIAAPTCDGTVVVSQAGWCVDCTCTTSSVRADCAAGGRVCQAGECVAPSCLGIVCASPPVAVCEGSVAVSYSESGNCVDGGCQYTRQERDCAQLQSTCTLGRCFPLEICGDGVDNDFDGQRDCADTECASLDLCRDDCPSDPTKMRPGVCGCGVRDRDSDGDETFDCNEVCTLDPRKTEPGLCGCGLADNDADEDGVLDCHDGCPAEAGKVSAGVCGCTVADTDTDQDGTPNCVDACPTDFAKIAVGACGCGVADTDSDNDGSPNCRDECDADLNKTAPGQCGCGVLDNDADEDGTADCNDECDGDPLKDEPGVCGCGTPDVDADDDGLLVCAEVCDDDPDKTVPGQCGCGFADDADGDGQVDCELCGDSLDNDHDHLLDCADPFCDGRPGCEEHLVCFNCTGDPPLVVLGALLPAPGAADVPVNSRVSYQLLSAIPSGTTVRVRYSLQGGAGFGHVFDDADLSATGGAARGRVTGGGMGQAFVEYEVVTTATLAIGARLDLTLASGVVRVESNSPAAQSITIAADLFNSAGAPIHVAGVHLAPFLWVAPAVETGECADTQDDDFDGVVDCQDEDCFFDNACDTCPSNLNKWRPGVCGCDVADSDYDGDALLDCLDTDDDNDGVADGPDQCERGGLSNWASSTANDYDSDGCHNTEDADDDNDLVTDTTDRCPMGALGWSSTATRDHDADGCRDVSEDGDDDNDGVGDASDACVRGDTNWTASATTDHDDDGCRDGGEDIDDDNDGALDVADACARGHLGWSASATTDYDDDGCRDSHAEDPDDDNDGIADGLEGSLAEDANGDGLADRNGDQSFVDGGPCTTLGWVSTALTDHDSDGCKDSGEDNDDDNDGHLDTRELACGSLIRNAASVPVNTDDDVICDTQDWDDDNDDYDDTEEVSCASNPLDDASVPPDHDGDRSCDLLDLDDDNDGRLDSLDLCAFGHTGWSSNGLTDIDSDGCDAAEDLDDDGDGWPDIDEVHCSTNPNNNGSRPADLDGDIQCDTVDRDDDNDGLEDAQDPCPRVFSNTDTDGDRAPDCADQCPVDPAKTTAGYCGCGAPETCEQCSDQIDNNRNGLPDCSDEACNGACGTGRFCFLCDPNASPVQVTSRFFSSTAYPTVPLQHELVYRLNRNVPAGSGLYVIFYFYNGGTWATGFDASHLSLSPGTAATVTVNYVGGGHPGAYYVYWHMTVGGAGLVAGEEIRINARDAGVHLPAMPYGGVLQLEGYGYYLPPTTYYWYWEFLGYQVRPILRVTEDRETSCTNNLDDNFDGLRDCDDATCAYEGSFCDQCPSHAGLSPGVCGCSVPEDLDGDGDISCLTDPDDDNDGVFDVDDTCPLGAFGVLSSPFTDADGDGCFPEEDDNDDGDAFKDDDEIICQTDPRNPASFPVDLDRDWTTNGETCRSCEADCGACNIVLEGRCGDRVCDPALENCANCPRDCGQCVPTCGNGQIDGGENCLNCFDDVGECADCGNGHCNAMVQDDPDNRCNPIDDDDDGDGALDVDEMSCGSNPADFLSRPIDPDLDGSCSVYDENDDGDALLDGEDPCPLEALPHADADGDLSPNCLDLCPADRNKSAPGSCGCGVVDDADNNGTPDCEDCGDNMDNDGDGVWDCGDSTCYSNAALCPEPFVVCYNCPSDEAPPVLDTALRENFTLTAPLRALVQYRMTRAVAAASVVTLEVRLGIGASFAHQFAPAHLSVERQTAGTTADVVTLVSGGAQGDSFATFRVQLGASRGLAVGDELHVDLGPTSGAAVVLPRAFANFEAIRLYATLRDGAGNLVDAAAATTGALFTVYRACTDGIDNDADGKIDCLDPQCDGFAAGCEDTCTDGHDDDIDGLADCNDDDCVGAVCEAGARTGICNVLQSLEWNLASPVIAWNTSNATDYRRPSCNMTALLKDHMFAWTAPQAGQFTIDTTGSASDTIIEVLNGDCYGSVIACNDTLGTSPQGGVVVTLAAQQSVTIIVSAAGGYVLNIEKVQQ